jgi:hypothetical protein
MLTNLTPMINQVVIIPITSCYGPGRQSIMSQLHRCIHIHVQDTCEIEARNIKKSVLLQNGLEH